MSKATPADPAESRVSVAFRLSPKTAELIRSRAEAENRYPAQLVTQAVEEYAKNNPLPKKPKTAKVKKSG